MWLEFQWLKIHCTFINTLFKTVFVTQKKQTFQKHVSYSFRCKLTPTLYVFVHYILMTPCVHYPPYLTCRTNLPFLTFFFFFCFQYYSKTMDAGVQWDYKLLFCACTRSTSEMLVYHNPRFRSISIRILVCPLQHQTRNTFNNTFRSTLIVQLKLNKIHPFSDSVSTSSKTSAACC